jgi:predicted N-formylglutamate amidohydrolase
MAVSRGDTADAPPAATVTNATGRSPWVLLCEHASPHIPARYNGLGLGAADLLRHIAWDIGALAIARRLSAALDAPLISAGYSRLLVDCNRPQGTPTFIPAMSETTAIPGNTGLSATEIADRTARYWQPFQDAVAAHLDARRAAERPAVVFGVHTFTPVFKGVARPWHGGVLFRHSTALAERLLAALQEPGLVLAANEPYQIADDHDQTVPVHGEARGLDALLIEVRQDLVADDAGAAAWADRLAWAMRTAVPDDMARAAAPRSL